MPRPKRPNGTTMLDLTTVAPGAPGGIDGGPFSPLYFTPFERAQARAFDYVIVGAGCVGTTLAQAILERDPHARILVLEKGGFLLPEHVQNVDPAFQPLMTTAVATPWRYEDGPDEGGYGLTPQVPYVGGRTLFWSTWIPQPAPDQMADWPDELIDDLEAHWGPAHRVLGAIQAKDLGPEFDTLHPRLRREIFRAATDSGASAWATGPGDDLSGFLRWPDEAAIEARLASDATWSRLRYRKYSPVGPLLEAARREPARLAVVAGCEVTGLRADGDRIVAVHTTQGDIDLDQARLILANGTVEATGLLLGSVADRISRLAGTNLGGHVATWFSCRIPRERFAELPNRLQVSCLYLDGRYDHRQFHVHFMAAWNPHPAESTDDLYRLIPDSFDQDFLAELTDPRYLGFLIHALGEMKGVKGATAPSRVTVDDAGTVVHVSPTPTDMNLWMGMDQSANALVSLLAGDEAVEYWDADLREWTPHLPASRHKKLLVHETGTLWMGRSADDSVTDLHGRLHGLANAYVAGPATFPSCGSWNPTLTAVALGRRLAAHLVATARKVAAQ